MATPTTRPLSKDLDTLDLERPQDPAGTALRAERLAERTLSPAERCRALCLASASYCLAGDLEKARERVSTALHLAEAHQLDEGIEEILVQAADVALSEGREEKAYLWIHTLLTLRGLERERNIDRSEQAAAWLLWRKARRAEELGDLVQSEHLLRQAAPDLGAYDAGRLRVDLGRVLLVQGRESECLAELRGAHASLAVLTPRRMEPHQKALERLVSTVSFLELADAAGG